MTIMQAFWLGLVQGLGEFLPVSSTGHLDLLQKIFGFSVGNYLTLDVLLHLGTLVAVVAVYWKRLLNMIQHPVKSDLWLLVVATIPAIVFALAFDIDFSPESLGFEFLITTLILWLADLVGGVSFQTKEVKWYNALVMGVMQALAILPAVSRSGAATPAAWHGLTKSAQDFRVLMSVPAIWRDSCWSYSKTARHLRGRWSPRWALAAARVGILTSAVFGSWRSSSCCPSCAAAADLVRRVHGPPGHLILLISTCSTVF